jgi:hypothetical protein
VQRRDEDRRQAIKTFEEISLRLDRRLYRMRRLYWAARDTAAGRGDAEDLALSRAEHREVLAEWNDNLNRITALTETYFGTPVRAVLEYQVHEDFASVGRGLEEIVKMIAASGGERTEIPRFAYRLTGLSQRAYKLNIWMLRLLKEDRIGRYAPQEAAAAATMPASHPQLAIGDQGTAVRTLQRSLLRAGQAVDIDGIFRNNTWLAVRSLQRSAGLDADGIVGPDTWAAIPAAPMPLLRPGSKGETVAALQHVLARHAPGRWHITPAAVTGVFDHSTSEAVQAFQRWNAIAADGLIGQQTWAAAIDSTAISLEAAVARERPAGYGTP